MYANIIFFSHKIPDIIPLSKNLYSHNGQGFCPPLTDTFLTAPLMEISIQDVKSLHSTRPSGLLISHPFSFNLYIVSFEDGSFFVVEAAKKQFFAIKA